MTEEDSESGKFPPWVDRHEVFKDVATILVKYGLTVGQFYDSLGVNVYEKTLEDVIRSANLLADLRRELTLEARKK